MGVSAAAAAVRMAAAGFRVLVGLAAAVVVIRLGQPLRELLVGMVVVVVVVLLAALEVMALLSSTGQRGIDHEKSMD